MPAPLRVLILGAVLFGGALAGAACATGSDANGLGAFGGAGTAGPATSTSTVGQGASTSTAGPGTSTAGPATSTAGPATSTSTSTVGPSTSTTGAGGAGGAGPSASTASSASSTSSSTSGGSCAIGHMVISEIRSRGAGGASDEFIELFNATSAPVVLGSGWKIEARSSTGTSYSGRWTGTGKSVPAWGHYLIAGTGYTQSPAADDSLTSGITDAASVRLVDSGATVSAVCYYFGTNPFDSTFTCDGTPVVNPHDNSTATNMDVSIERKPGGTTGNCTDTGDDASDFQTSTPATPLDTSSAPTP